MFDLDCCLDDVRWTHAEKTAVIADGVSLADVVAHVDTLFARVSARVLVHGNMNAAEAAGR
jgi:secreted Zn-dependent insulinase-like peptidase